MSLGVVVSNFTDSFGVTIRDQSGHTVSFPVGNNTSGCYRFWPTLATDSVQIAYTAVSWAPQRGVTRGASVWFLPTPVRDPRDTTNWFYEVYWDAIAWWPPSNSYLPSVTLRPDPYGPPWTLAHPYPGC
jgi:hypothetical protein